MGSTSNYSWPTPESTDLVKDGWEAIKDLGDAADASLKTVADASGLVHINTTSFSAVASVSLPDNTFSSTYENYLLKFSDLSAGNNTDFTLRLRASGTDLTTGVYRNNTLAGPSITWTTSTTDTAWPVGQYANSLDRRMLEIDLINPATATYTLGRAQSQATTGTYSIYRGLGVQNTNIYDSATLIISTGTMSGKIMVYGFKE